MSTTTSQVASTEADPGPDRLGEEYEHEPVPLTAADTLGSNGFRVVSAFLSTPLTEHA